ncbi:MAG: hypothetical protein ACE5H3_00395 [Planctomycetota bacterium]
MKRTHMLRGVTRWFAPSLILAAILGCGDGTDSSPEGPSGNTKAQSPAGEEAADERATLLDVLHLTNYATISYEGALNGNSMGNTYWTGALKWDGLSFSADESYVVDKGMSVEQNRRIQVRGRIAGDFASLKEVHIEVTSVAKSSGAETKDQFTFRDVPVNEIYATPGKDWRSRPVLEYTMTCKRGEIPDHLEGWRIDSKDSKQVTTISDQKELLLVYVPGDKATLEISVFFRKEAP